MFGTIYEATDQFLPRLGAWRFQLDKCELDFQTWKEALGARLIVYDCENTLSTCNNWMESDWCLVVGWKDGWFVLILRNNPVVPPMFCREDMFNDWN